jgi:hypothetical protein
MQTSNEKRVDLVVDSEELNPEDKYKVVFINGQRIQIEKDVEVEVRPIVKDILRESRDLNKKGNKKEMLVLD